MGEPLCFLQGGVEASSTSLPAPEMDDREEIESATSPPSLGSPLLSGLNNPPASATHAAIESFPKSVTVLPSCNFVGGDFRFDDMFLKQKEKYYEFMCFTQGPTGDVEELVTDIET